MQTGLLILRQMSTTTIIHVADAVERFVEVVVDYSDQLPPYLADLLRRI